MPRMKGKKVPMAKFTCGMCGQLKLSKEFYASFNSLHTTNKIPYCKKCLKEACIRTDGYYDMNKVKEVLQMIDRPYLAYQIYTNFEKYDCDSSKRDCFGLYLKDISMPQYKELFWKDSVFTITDKEIQEKTDKTESKKNAVASLEKIREAQGLVVNDEVREFFGAGYSDDEYYAMKRKYDFLKKNYSDTTSFHIEALKTYVRFKVKEEFATALGDMTSAKTWSALAASAATSAKINPSQLSKADLQGGLNSFAELIKATEQAVDIIPILPRFKYRPNDALDFNIWCYVNYIRRLNGMPECNYEDVYKFYDSKKKEYVEQYGDPYGIFADDPTEGNREKIKQFIIEPKYNQDIEGDEE